MKKISLFMPILLLLVVSCSIFQEVDITGDEVLLLAPSNNVTVNNRRVTFKWDLIDGAETYNLMVVKPSFDQISEIALDTFVVNLDLLSFNLPDGNYQWGVMALNSEYQTERFFRSMIVKDTVETLDIREDQITVTSPLDNTSTTETKITFLWDYLEGATEYELLVYSIATLDEDADPKVNEKNLTTNLVKVDLVVGDYEWTLRAKNDKYISKEIKRKFTITKVVTPVP